MKRDWEDPTIQPITSLAQAAFFPTSGKDFKKKGSQIA